MHKNSYSKMKWFKENYLKNDDNLDILDVSSIDSTKKFNYKEIFDEDIRKSYQPDKNNNNLYQYGCNIFQLYEIIDSINTQDIKEYIDKYIIQQEPIVRYKDKEII